MTGTAIISDCERYRYKLTRVVAPAPNIARPRLCNFIMLNPSTADATEDDPTIRRCIGFAKAAGCHGLIVTNLFGFRSKDPESLYSADDPIGPENYIHVVKSARDAVESRGIIICAWGAHPKARYQSDVVVRSWLCDYPLHTLQLTKGGAPSHPLYLKKTLTPERWDCST